MPENEGRVDSDGGDYLLLVNNVLVLLVSLDLYRLQLNDGREGRGGLFLLFRQSACECFAF